MMLPSPATVFGLLSLLATQLSATPIAEPAPPTKPGPAPPPFSWDAEYVRKHFIKHVPEPNDCLFYTRGLKADAILFGHAHSLTTVYDVYDNDEVFNPKKSPFKDFVDAKREREWFQTTSEAFAEVCKGNVYLVMKDGTSVPADAIWATHEYPALKRSNTLKSILVIDTKEGTWGLYDEKPGAVQRINNPWAAKLKRSVDATESSVKERDAAPESANSDITKREVNMRIDAIINGVHLLGVSPPMYAVIYATLPYYLDLPDIS